MRKSPLLIKSPLGQLLFRRLHCLAYPIPIYHSYLSKVSIKAETKQTKDSVSFKLKKHLADSWASKA